MHPAVFVSGFVFLGALFALQSWVSAHMWKYKMDFLVLLQAWGVQYLIWGVICWLIWLWFGPQIQQASLGKLLLFGIPLSLIVSVGEEMIWVFCFPQWPINRAPMSYWERLTFELDGEGVDNLVIFWFAVLLFRGIGYYQRYREKENAAAQLEVQLVQAQLRALRMQLNPHFLFNTLNSVSSLMRTDIAAADTVLEQLSSLLRIALERGEVQLIPLSDEMEFVEMYLAIQDQRYAGRVREVVRVDPALHDALVPAMILQPILENAYIHGLSLLDCGGLLVVEAKKDADYLELAVLNSGVGLNPSTARSAGQGVGLANVRTRLRLHYGEDHKFMLEELDTDKVRAKITLPLQFSMSPKEKLARYGA